MTTLVSSLETYRQNRNCQVLILGRFLLALLKVLRKCFHAHYYRKLAMIHGLL